MTMRTNAAMTALLALALAACTANGNRTEGLSELSPDSGTCEPTWEVPLMLTTGSRDVVGRVVWSMSATEISATVVASSGWEIGDVYLGVGHDGMAPDWTVANADPWTTGWLTEVTITMPLDAAIACGDMLKLQIQTNVRPVGTWSHELASAFGPQDRGEWGWADFRRLCCDTPPPPDSGCTLTQGFWKTHPEAWPVSSLTIGGTTYDQSELLALMWTPVSGDASVMLAHQLIAAELNVAAGASPVPAIADAQAWMAANGGTLPYGIAPDTAAGAEAVALNEVLTDYNEGRVGPGHCDHDVDEDVDEDTDEDTDEDMDEGTDEGPPRGPRGRD